MIAMAFRSEFISSTSTMDVSSTREITVERTFLILAESPVLGLISRSDGLSWLVSGCLGHAFGGASGRRAQEKADFLRGENAQDGIHEVSCDTRAAGDHITFERRAAWIAVFWLSASASHVRFHPRDAFSASIDFHGIAPG